MYLWFIDFIAWLYLSPRRASCDNMTSLAIHKFSILSVNEKLPVLKFRYFGKYIIQLLVTVTFTFLVNDKLVWRDKTVTRALELWCT